MQKGQEIPRWAHDDMWATLRWPTDFRPELGDFGLKDDYEDKISAFRKAYLALNINVTSKAHILFDHTVEFIKKNGRSLSLFAEQSAEASHADFDDYWDRYKVRSSTHPNLGPRLQRCVVSYNGEHV